MLNTPFRIAALLTLGLTLGAQSPVLNQGKAESITEAIPDDPAVAKLLAPLAQDMKAQFGRVLTEASTNLTRGAQGDENLLGYWVTDLMRERAQEITGQPVRFAITNKGGLRANLPKGPIKVEHIYMVMPFENEMVVAEYTGAEIIEIMKEGIRRRGGEPVSGVKASVTGTPEQPVYAITWSDGSPINPAETVRVALTDFLLASGDSMPTLKKGRNSVVTGLPLRTVLLDACTRLSKTKSPILPPPPGRYVFTPEITQGIQNRTLAN